MLSRTDEPTDPVVLLAGVLAELGHLAEHGDGAMPRVRHLREGLQRRRHRVGTGVVGVVDDGRSPRTSMTSMRQRSARVTASRPATMSPRPTPRVVGHGSRSKRIADMVLTENPKLNRPRCSRSQYQSK